MAEQENPTSYNPKQLMLGMNMNAITSQINEGETTYSLNAIVQNFDGKSITYQNEQANILCSTLPLGYKVIGVHNIIEDSRIIFFLVNPSTKDCEIGALINCEYSAIINSPCLKFDINHPIHKIVHKKRNCSTEIYWVDGLNKARYINLDSLPYVTAEEGCEKTATSEIDCNKLSLQPNFNIPEITIKAVDSDGELTAGDYQFAIQYSNAIGEPYTAFYSVTNPTPIFDPNKITNDFNYKVGKSIEVEVSNIDTTGYYDYINIAVVKTINNISSVELIGTFQITGETYKTNYTGQSATNIQLSTGDIFQKYPIYDIADDLTTAQDVLILKGLTTQERISYQSIANQIKLNWQTWRIPNKDGYKNPLNTINRRGYMRDEIYPYEIVFELTNGYQTDGFHIPGRKAEENDLEIIHNSDVPQEKECVAPVPLPRWKVYNTGALLGNEVNLSSQTVCHEEEIPGSESSDVTSTITLTCSDDSCSSQGEIGLKITFPSPLSEDVQILLGAITRTQSGDNKYVGSDIFTVPPWAIPDAFYSDPTIPFSVDIPKGTTSLTIPAIYQSGFNGNPLNVWICHSCLFPITHLFLKVNTSIDFNIDFSLTNNGIVFQDNSTHISSTPSSTIEVCEEIVDNCYEGPYQYGEFAYWESTELYPCNSIYGELSNTPIRHHKFPDSLITHIHDNQDNIYPIGVKIDVQQIVNLINESGLTQEQKSLIQGFKIVRGNRANNKSITAKGLIRNVGKYVKEDTTYYFPNYLYNDLRRDPFLSSQQTANDTGSNEAIQLDAFSTEESKQRFTLQSPDTTFYQPTLPNILKLETAEYGTSKGHFVQVKDHAKYKFLTLGSYMASLGIGIGVGFASGTVGDVIFSSAQPFDGTAAFTAYQAMLDVLVQVTPKRNFTYQYNSIGNYINYHPVENNGNKQRILDIEAYLSPGMLSVGDVHNINNYQRESSVYLRTTASLPNTNSISGVPEDESKWVLSQNDCNNAILEKPISAYYASLKKEFSNQYGQLYSYETIDTGYQKMIDLNKNDYQKETIFGGDTFINKFGYKSKMPFFLDNRVKFPDDADVFYNELGNVAFPTYWMSTDNRDDHEHLPDASDLLVGLIPFAGPALLLSKLKDIFQTFFGVKKNNFDCDDTGKKVFYQDGKVYLFAYGIPYFYCESEVNTDFRQAYNSKEGDFYPHVSSDIPDDWLQEVNTSIQQDNTYTYNTTYSKQNKENFFSHLPPDFSPTECTQKFPFRAIFSEEQKDTPNPSQRNNWLIFKPSAYFDFPQSYGKLTSLEGIQNRQVLARFENKLLLYNALLTAPTSAAEVYLGQSLFDQRVPPLDYADTDLGYGGSQHKFFLKTEYGPVTIDSKRGQIFLLGERLTDISGKCSKFLTEFLDFKITKQFPNINIDNHFNGIGITGVYDSKYNRLILTKLDYECLDTRIHFDTTTGVFSKNGLKVELGNPDYFCNHSFTISYDFDNQSWISFHSYLPNYYIGESNFFYSGLNDKATLWKHNTEINKFNNFYGKIEPYVIEYPYSYKSEKDEIIQSIKDYTQVLQYTDFNELIEIDDAYFNKLILHSNQQCSGVLKLTKKPVSNLKAYNEYPKYADTYKEVLYTKSDSLFKINTFWNMLRDIKQGVWKKSCINLSILKDLNQSNMQYSKRSFAKSPIRSKELRVRYILDDRDDIKLLSQFILSETAKSYK